MEIKQTDWFKSRPKIIQDLICRFPYAATVRIKETKQIAYVYSWDENGTISVVITQEDNPGIRNAIPDENYCVFGYKPDDLVFINENPDLNISEHI